MTTRRALTRVVSSIQTALRPSCGVVLMISLPQMRQHAFLDLGTGDEAIEDGLPDLMQRTSLEGKTCRSPRADEDATLRATASFCVRSVRQRNGPRVGMTLEPIVYANL